MESVSANRVTADEATAALAGIVNSSGFATSARLRSLLSYVVEETLAGRADAIRAKTIGMDVYGYSAEDISAREGVVRVDAGRLRRKLQEYYDGEGQQDATVISLPLGGYVPQFERQTGSVSTLEPHPQGGRKWMWVSACVAAIAVVAVIAATGLFFERKARDSAAVADGIDLRDIYDISPARVEATNLAQVGRGIIFPAVDPARLQIALQTFDAAVTMDPTYFGGYAGAAQVLATLALLSPDPRQSADLLERADRRSREALDLSPDAAWALSARAWVHFVSGDRANAIELSHRAVAIEPADPHIAEFDSLISLYSLDFQRIFDEAERRAEEGSTDRGFVFQNVLGAAKFHTGDYAGAITEFENAIRAGGPFGPVSITYLMAARHRNGDAVEAAKLAELLRTRWPEARVDQLFARLFADPGPAEELADGMRGAGWKPSGDPS